MKKNIYTLTDVHTYSSGATTRVNLPRSGYITHMDCLLEVAVVGGSVVSAAEDALARLISSCRIKGAGARSYFDISDGRQWLYDAHLRYEGQIMSDSLPSAGASDTVRLELPIHWGFEPLNTFDPSVVIPAVDVPNMVMEVSWGAASDLGTGFTISSATLKITICEIALEPGESKEAIWREGIPSPRMEPTILDSISIKSNLGLANSVPVGDCLNRTLIMVLDSSGDRSDADITEVGVKFPKRREEPYRKDWQPQKAETRRHFGIPSSLTGIAMMLWNRVPGGRPLGLDLSLAVEGDVKLCFTSAVSAGDVHLLHYAVS